MTFLSTSNSFLRIKLGSEFLQFFVDDMLDYTVLKNKERNFKANEFNFDIKTSIQEIVEMHEKNIQQKEISV